MSGPRRNRVTPLGEIIADPARGLVYGNRGCLHDAHGQIRRSHSGRLWIACRLEFKGRRRPLLRPGRYTELFFLDDATALAAGHRPCAECRREDYDRFLEAWPDPFPPGPRAPVINAQLHAERLDEHGTQRHHSNTFDALPDGTFVLREGAPWLVEGTSLRRWTPGGYADAIRRPRGTAVVITPPSLVAVLAGGWRPTAVPFIHKSR
ncbi:hypothetical protein OJ997_00820 [Solirubrobacter phytolaccae]|uniref:Ada DNA repair metal-binding domain-containing protein n=1 Tax=Solirubrobacter phytolaccae TaxID=1404360 RepID=A0A9X3S761_9ACTN|nr:hypothetical protein [Solirubrobacter phytolaccae]MDA0178821.1 hypothetical protein [Solirubrobacter phytolaccae]